MARRGRRLNEAEVEELGRLVRQQPNVTCKQFAVYFRTNKPSIRKAMARVRIKQEPNIIETDSKPLIVPATMGNSNPDSDQLILGAR